MNRKRNQRTQKTFGFVRRGGRRPGAGRKPKGERAGVSHKTRAPLASRFPVHVTMRLERGLPGLRNKRAYRVLRRVFAGGGNRLGFRVAQFAVMSNHVHLIVEAKDRTSLSRGMQGLSVRMAHGLNGLWKRVGRVFADRYHDRILRTPREVRNALCYVLNNARRHGCRIGRGPDPYSSGSWFDGWREAIARSVPEELRALTENARTWLLTRGWRRHRVIGLQEVPGSG